jgi:hypothetical protein
MRRLPFEMPLLVVAYLACSGIVAAQPSATPDAAAREAAIRVVPFGGPDGLGAGMRGAW